MTTLGAPDWLLLSLASMALVGTADLLARRATLRGVATASFMVDRQGRVNAASFDTCVRVCHEPVFKEE